MRSPLDLACVLAPETMRYPHVEVLNDHLVALVEYRLYSDGPGEPGELFYSVTDWDTMEETNYPVLDMEHVPWEDEGLTEVFYARPGNPDDRVILRLGIAMPPRHGKPYMVSEWFPLWLWLRNPTSDMALATYNDDFASSEWGVKLRDKLVAYGDKLGREVQGGGILDTICWLYKKHENYLGV